MLALCIFIWAFPILKSHHYWFPLPTPIFKVRWKAVWAEGYLLSFHNLISASGENDPLCRLYSRNAHALWESWQDVSLERIIPFPTRRSDLQISPTASGSTLGLAPGVGKGAILSAGGVGMICQITSRLLKVSLPYATGSVFIQGLRFSRRCYHT